MVVAVEVMMVVALVVVVVEVVYCKIIREKEQKVKDNRPGKYTAGKKKKRHNPWKS